MFSVKPHLLLVLVVLSYCYATGRERASRSAHQWIHSPPNQEISIYVDLPPLDGDRWNAHSYRTGGAGGTETYTGPSELHDDHSPSKYYSDPYASAYYGVSPNVNTQNIHQATGDRDPLLNPSASYRPAFDPDVFRNGAQKSDSEEDDVLELKSWEDIEHHFTSWESPDSKTDGGKASSSSASRLTTEELYTNHNAHAQAGIDQLHVYRHGMGLSPMTSPQSWTQSGSSSRMRRPQIVRARNEDAYDQEEQEQEEAFAMEPQSYFDYFTPLPAVTPEDIQREANRQILRQEWESRKLSCTMKPQELAAEVAEIKINHPTIAGSIGNFVSIIVRDTARHKKGYYQEYSDWTYTYTSKIKNLKASFLRLPDLTPEMLRIGLLANFRNLDSYAPLVDPHPSLDVEQAELQRAAVIWSDFVHTRGLQDLIHPGEEIPIRRIATESRTYQYGTLTVKQTVKYLRKYMIKHLHASQKQMASMGKLHREDRKRRQQKDLEED